MWTSPALIVRTTPLSGSIEGGIAVMKMDIEGCFLTRDSAEKFARQILCEKLGEYRTGVKLEPPSKGMFSGLILTRDNAGATKLELIISVVPESGEMAFPTGSA